MSTSQSCSSEQLPVPVRVPSLRTEDMGIRWAGEGWPAHLAAARTLATPEPLDMDRVSCTIPTQHPHASRVMEARTGRES